ncbi:putative tail fiber protein [Rhodococcus phage E3]|uniref:virion structural protein n=1 Tax=Rhodococcus phage E3 TaxID=1007869 RepID=UPI0002C6D92D|nr:virion structural protein [Rhodococcus phage E3]AEQ21124.1 putative tail fiber protein [Rhodococcus phage E3]
MIYRTLKVDFARAVTRTGSHDRVEVAIRPLDTTHSPIDGATYIDGPAAQTMVLSEAKNTVEFRLVPSYAEGLTEPVLYRASWRVGLTGRLETVEFSMPNMDVTLAQLQDMGEIIGELPYLKEGDLGVPGRVARLNDQGKVIDAFGNIVDGSGSAVELGQRLDLEIANRQSADAALNTSLSNEISNRVTSVTTAFQNLLSAQIGSVVSTANADRASMGSGLAIANGRIISIEATLPKKADLVDGRLPLSQAPLVQLGQVHAATNQAAMLGLTGVAVGDVCLRPDGSWMLTAQPPSLLKNWTQITSPSDTVMSVNGKIGVVTLTAADVGAWSNATLLPQNAIQSLPTDLATIRQNVAAHTVTLSSAVLVNETGMIDDAKLSGSVAFLNSQNQVVNKAGQVVIVSGNVSSVNGKSGAVVLKASDVGAVGVGSQISMSYVTGLVLALQEKVGINDASVTNARTPLSHAASHSFGGQDPLTPAAIGALAANAQIPQSQITGLLTDMALKASQSDLQITNNQVQKNTIDIASLIAGGGGSGGGGIAGNVVSWANGSSTNPYTASIMSPFGWSSANGYYYNAEGAAAGEAVWPYITPNGRLELRRVNHSAPVDPAPATATDIAAVQGQIDTVNGKIPGLATKTALDSTNSNVAGISTAITLLAPLASPTFTGTASTPALRVTGGTLAAGRVLTSDASGNATWQAVPVVSVAGKTGAVVLAQSDITGLVSDLGAKADRANPTFTGTTTISALRVTGGSLGAGKTLISDASGNATWQVPPSAPVSSVSGHTGDVTLVPSDVVGLSTLMNAKADLVGGVIRSDQIPALAMHTVVTAASQADMLALTTSQVQRGDMCIITGGAERGNYILTADSPAILSNWVPLVLPAQAVSSVNGKTGVAVLSAADVGAIATGAMIPQSQITGLLTDLGGKADSSALANYLSKTEAQAQSTTKNTVKYAATSSVTSLSGTSTLIDSRTLVAGDRVLLPVQSSSKDNGIWVVQSGAWTRPADMPTSSIVVTGTQVIVTDGATLANTVWQMNGTTSTNVGTTPQTWTKSLVAGPPVAYTSGPGIQIVGNTVSSNYGDGLKVVGQQLTVDPDVVARKKVIPITQTTKTVTLTHNLNTQFVWVSIIDNQTSSIVLAGATVSTANAVSVEFEVAPTSTQYTAVVFG